MRSTVRRKVTEKQSDLVTKWQDLNRKKNVFKRVMKRGKPTPRAAILDSMTNWQTSQMMRACKGKINDLSDEQLVEFSKLKKGASLNGENS